MTHVWHINPAEENIGVNLLATWSEMVNDNGCRMMLGVRWFRVINYRGQWPTMPSTGWQCFVFSQRNHPKQRWQQWTVVDVNFSQPLKHQPLTIHRYDSHPLSVNGRIHNHLPWSESIIHLRCLRILPLTPGQGILSRYLTVQCGVRLVTSGHGTPHRQTLTHFMHDDIIHPMGTNRFQWLLLMHGWVSHWVGWWKNQHYRLSCRFSHIFPPFLGDDDGQPFIRTPSLTTQAPVINRDYDPTDSILGRFNWVPDCPQICWLIMLPIHCY